MLGIVWPQMYHNAAIVLFINIHYQCYIYSLNLSVGVCEHVYEG